jgi:hypothetical protein
MMIIHTPTIDDFIEIVDWAFDQGIMWCSGSDSISESFWYKHNINTCVIIDKQLSYCRRAYAIVSYNKENILSMAEFHLKNKISYMKKFCLK